MGSMLRVRFGMGFVVQTPGSLRRHDFATLGDDANYSVTGCSYDKTSKKWFNCVVVRK